MNVKETANPDAIVGSSFILMKYILEQSLMAAFTTLPPDDPMFPLIKAACSAPVDEDTVSLVMMGYCIAEKDVLRKNMECSFEFLKGQIKTLEDSIGG